MRVETLEAVENAEAIAAVDGVDVLFVGPADLGFDLKARGASVTLDDCLPKVAAAAKAAGKFAEGKESGTSEYVRVNMSLVVGMRD